MVEGKNVRSWNDIRPGCFSPGYVQVEWLTSLPESGITFGGKGTIVMMVPLQVMYIQEESGTFSTVYLPHSTLWIHLPDTAALTTQETP